MDKWKPMKKAVNQKVIEIHDHKCDLMNHSWILLWVGFFFFFSLLHHVGKSLFSPSSFLFFSKRFILVTVRFGSLVSRLCSDGVIKHVSGCPPASSFNRQNITSVVQFGTKCQAVIWKLKESTHIAELSQMIWLTEKSIAISPLLFTYHLRRFKLRSNLSHR